MDSFAIVHSRNWEKRAVSLRFGFHMWLASSLCVCMLTMENICKYWKVLALLRQQRTDEDVGWVFNLGTVQILDFFLTICYCFAAQPQPHTALTTYPRMSKALFDCWLKFIVTVVRTMWFLEAMAGVSISSHDMSATGSWDSKEGWEVPWTALARLAVNWI